jgi:hypothetical protein
LNPSLARQAAVERQVEVRGPLCCFRPGFTLTAAAPPP